MKKTLILLSFSLLLGCNSNMPNNNREIANKKEPTIPYYYSNMSEWGLIQHFMDTTIRKKLLDNIRDTSFEFIIQFYESTSNVVPVIDNLISIKFNRSDSILFYDYYTSIIKINGKKITPLMQHRTFWTNKYFNPVDTVFSRLNSFDFWNQPSEVKVNGADGSNFCIILKNKNKINYVLRWSPDGVEDSKYPKRKEFMRLCDLFKNLGKIGFYDNHWNWCGTMEKL